MINLPFVTISIAPETREKLKAAKLYKHESYDELMNRLLEAGKHG